MMLYTGDVDTSSSCALLWKYIFNMLSCLLHSAGQDAYIALTSALVHHWKLVSGMIGTYCLGYDRDVLSRVWSRRTVSGMIETYSHVLSRCIVGYDWDSTYDRDSRRTVSGMIQMYCLKYDSAVHWCHSNCVSLSIISPPFPPIDNIWAMMVVCSVLYCVLKLYTVISTLTWAVLTVLWIGFCLTGPISLCLDSFVFVFVFLCLSCLTACVLYYGNMVGWTW